MQEPQETPSRQNAVKYVKISVLKVCILSLLAPVLYPIYWFYKQWRAVKSAGAEQGKFPAALAALFYPFTAFFLVSAMKKDAAENNIKLSGAAVAAAAVFLAAGLNAAGDKVPDSLILIFLALSLILMAFGLGTIQKNINRIIPPWAEKERAVKAGDAVCVALTLVAVALLIGISVWENAEENKADPCFAQSELRGRRIVNDCMAVSLDFPLDTTVEDAGGGRFQQTDESKGLAFAIKMEGTSDVKIADFKTADQAARTLLSDERRQSIIRQELKGPHGINMYCYTMKDDAQPQPKIMNVCIFNRGNRIIALISAGGNTPEHKKLFDRFSNSLSAYDAGFNTHGVDIDKYRLDTR